MEPDLILFSTLPTTLTPAIKTLNLTPWYALPATRQSLNLKVCLEGGQAFNWVQLGNEHWAGVINFTIITLTYSSCGRVLFNCNGPSTTEEAYYALVDYFRLTV